MAEYIKIEKNTFPTFYKRNLTDYGKGWNACLNSVLQHKAKNVVEVVRCKDCKRFYSDVYNGKVLQRECRLRSIGSGIGIVFIESETDFCSYGERSDNNV